MFRDTPKRRLIDSKEIVSLVRQEVLAPRAIQSELASHHLVTMSTRVVNLTKTDEQEAWPNSRSLNEIENIYGMSFRQMLGQLQPGSKVLDIGPGKGLILAQIADQFPLACYGIATNKLDAAYQSKAKEVSYHAVPESKSWLQRHRGFFDMCLDTYSSLTYSPNALHSLLYILLAMKPGGKLCAMSSLTPGDREHSRFGDSVTRVRMVVFFKEVFNVDLFFEYKEILSKACKPGQMMDDLRVMMRVPESGIVLPLHLQNVNSVWSLFQALCTHADNTIGVPVLRPNSVAFKAGKRAIASCDFIAPDEKYLRLGWK